MKAKLTKTERRASEYCAELIRSKGGTVTVDWSRSRMWGMNPTIRRFGDKCCQVSGCGYDKLSTALAEVLRFLFPPDTKEHSTIWQTGGAGESSTMRALKEYGWQLEKISSGKAYDVYTIKDLK